MEVAAKLALFTGALVLALVAGWGLGQLAGPYLTTFTPAAAYTPADGAEHVHPLLIDPPLTDPPLTDPEQR